LSQFVNKDQMTFDMIRSTNHATQNHVVPSNRLFIPRCFIKANK